MKTNMTLTEMAVAVEEKMHLSPFDIEAHAHGANMGWEPFEYVITVNGKRVCLFCDSEEFVVKNLLTGGLESAATVDGVVAAVKRFTARKEAA